MDSSRLYLFTLLSAALFFHTNCQETELETRSLDKEDTLNEKQLVCMIVINMNTADGF